MALIQYDEIKFSSKSVQIIDQANEIIQEYTSQGYDLTLRQLYYQFVSRGFIQNKQSEYKRLGSIINNGRMAGLIDWDAIVDRTRNLEKNSHWENPSEIVDACAKQYRVDLWEGQPRRVEVWIEKDALSGVIHGICTEWDVPYFSCRGYTSQSEMHVAAIRLEGYKKAGQEPMIIHLGDHDPSGIDMTRDIADRMGIFMGGIEVKRIALNLDQIQKYKPPPNPCKLEDVRAAAYAREFGMESWELDALDPKAITQLIRTHVEAVIDEQQWEEMLTRQNEGRAELKKICIELNDL